MMMTSASHQPKVTRPQSVAAAGKPYQENGTETTEAEGLRREEREKGKEKYYTIGQKKQKEVRK